MLSEGKSVLVFESIISRVAANREDVRNKQGDAMLMKEPMLQ